MPSLTDREIALGDDGECGRGQTAAFAYSTMYLVGLLEDPPFVVTATVPVFAPVGTIAVICVSESTVKFVVFTLPKVTLVVCVRLTPVITTEVPTGP